MKMQWRMFECMYIYKNECQKHIFIINKMLEYVWFGGNFKTEKTMQRHLCLFKEIFRGILDVLYAGLFSESNSPHT